jgi:hypothetical protein
VPAAPDTGAARGTSAEEPREELPDHERFVRHFGIRYFDVAALPIANPTATMTPGPGAITSSTISAPVLGIRYWIQNTIGVDAGIGLGFAGGSQEAVQNNPATGMSTDTTVGKTSTNGFAFHGGLPIALYSGRHYSFLVVPQFTVGFTSGTQTFTAPPPLMAAPQQELSGFLFDGGAVIGAELYFGFIGIPELALQASVGLSYRRSSFKWKSGSNSASDGTNTFGTNVQSDPWAIFVNNISATYYF